MSEHGGDIYGLGGAEYIDFSANINPRGLPEGVKRAIVENIGSYEAYPDVRCRELTAAISDSFQIDASWIVCGSGAADLIYRIALCFKPSNALLFAPTFSEYEQALRLCGSAVRYHYLREDTGFAPDESVLADITADTDIMFICNPNNPTGAAVKSGYILRIAEACARNGVILVIDECFTDFMADEPEYTFLRHLQTFPNAVILKAFTKIYAMAGIRLGFALCSDSAVIEKIRGVLQPWSVSTVASKCGAAALKETEYVAETKRDTANNRERLTAFLQGLPNVKVYPSTTNYILFKASDTYLHIKLKEQGFLIRNCDNFKGLSKGYYRIAVKGEADNQRLMNCIKRALEG